MARDVPRVLELSKDLWFELDKRFSVGGDMGSGQTPPQTVRRLQQCHAWSLAGLHFSFVIPGIRMATVEGRCLVLVYNYVCITDNENRAVPRK